MIPALKEVGKKSMFFTNKSCLSSIYFKEWTSLLYSKSPRSLGMAAAVTMDSAACCYHSCWSPEFLPLQRVVTY